MARDEEVIIIDADGRGEYIMPSDEDRLLAMLIYVLSFFTTIIGPLIIWLIKRNDSAFIDHHGKEYFNFIISYLVYGVIAGMTTVILIGIILVPIVAIGAFVFTIIAAIKAYGGETYRIPFIFRIIQ